MAELVTDMRFVDSQRRTLASVRFSDGTLGIAIESYCDNPECDSPHVMFTIHEVLNLDGAKGVELGQPLCKFDLDINTWLPGRVMASGENDQAYMQEFIDALDGTLKRRFRTRWRKAKQRKPSKPESLPPETPHSFPVIYGEVFPQAPVTVVQLGSRMFIVADHYCTDPQCDCNQVALTGADVSDGPEQMKTAFMLVVPLSGESPRMVLNMGIDDISVQQVYRKWLQGLRAPDLLAKRYAQMKAYGRGEKSPEGPLVPRPRPTRTPKIGRNQPCSCGSGKKYKRCCGRGTAMS